MNIAIIGATGMVGARTAAEAISRGHRVNAYTRSGKAPEGTTAHSIDLADTAALVNIVNNHDVTIVAVPGGRGTSAQPIIDAHRALIAAAPTGRLLVVSAEDFAVALIDEAEEPKHAGRRFTVAN